VTDEVAAAKRRARVRKVALGAGAIVLMIVLWEGYVALAEATDGRVFGWDLPLRYDQSAMPHITDIVARFGENAVEGRDGTVGGAVLAACWYTLRVSFAGLLLGLVIGFGLAVVMQRWKLAEQALLPYVIISQTVPLVALAPLLSAWSGKLSIGPIDWKPWYSVAVIAAYLAFFPIAVGALRGLQSPKAHHVELMRSLAAGGAATMVKLRFPASLPYLLPALRLAAAASIVGTVVAEISLGVKGGIGRLILDYFQRSTGDATNIYCAVLGAAALGIVVAALLAGFEHVALRNRPQEAV
jgi:NitT/TauT family transport system permease protein